jgi:ABC-2 type transport system permease protein
VAVVLITTVFGIAWGCLGLIIALRTKSVQATQSSFVLFCPFIFMTTAFMPKEFLPYWFQITTTINPVTYVLEAVRAIIVEGWVWSTVGLGVGILAAFTAFLLSVTTWLYNRQTA